MGEHGEDIVTTQEKNPSLWAVQPGGSLSMTAWPAELESS